MNASVSCTDHFVVIAQVILTMVSYVIFFSLRSSQGANDSIPVTPRYTRLRAYNPRSGASGKFHSPALKQKPWPIILVLQRLTDCSAALTGSLKKTVCLPLGLPAPCAHTRTPSN